LREGWIQRLREPEVENLDRPVGPQLDVAWLQIAMDDPLFVRRLECVRDLAAIGSASSIGIDPALRRSASVGPSTSRGRAHVSPSILQIHKSPQCAGDSALQGAVLPA